MSLPPDDPSINRLCRDFHSINEAARHFRDGHLKLVTEDAVDGVCPVCIPPVILETMRHLTNHTLKVHGLKY